MAEVKTKKGIGFAVEIGLAEGAEWSVEKLAGTKALVRDLAAKRSPERVLRNELLAIQYKMEEYAETDEKLITKSIPLEHFLNAYLEALGISFRKFAIAIDSNDANLKKYISGERRFNTDLARKFGSFFHTSPVTWMKVYQLNDLIKLRREKVARWYDKYDYRKVTAVVSGYKEAATIQTIKGSVKKGPVTAKGIAGSLQKGSASAKKRGSVQKGPASASGIPGSIQKDAVAIRALPGRRK